MSDPTSSETKAWLNAKDNWLGEGAFRDVPPSIFQKSVFQDAVEPIRSAQGQPHPAAEPAYADVYFAHG